MGRAFARNPGTPTASLEAFPLSLRFSRIAGPRTGGPFIQAARCADGSDACRGFAAME
jgi:hypothetical protein